jgi:hypothetical protein
MRVPTYWTERRGAIESLSWNGGVWLPMHPGKPEFSEVLFPTMTERSSNMSSVGRTFIAYSSPFATLLGKTGEIAMVMPMDGAQFDDVVRGFATGCLSRGQMLKGLVAGALVGLLPACQRESIEAICKPLGASCTGSSQCCLKVCSRGQCRRKPVGKACTNNQQCSSGNCENGLCRRSCPAERVCGTGCCAEGQICLNGACASATEGVCGSDPVTAESLDAARSAIEAGATDVPLSPGGCARLRRKVVAGLTTHEEVVVNEAVTLAWDHADTQSTGQLDADRDGFFEWRSTVQRGSAGEFLRKEVIEHAPATETLLRRETYTSSNDTVHVLWEEVDETGVLRTVASFDADPFEEAPIEDNASGRISENGETGAGGSRVADISTTGCSPEQDAQLKDRLRHAINVGLTCMGHYDATGIQLNIMFHYVARDIVIKCDVLPENVAARLDRKTYLDPESNVVIIVNKDGFFTKLSEYEQSKTLWHEMLHNHFGPHNKKARRLPRFDEFDQTEAREDLCFGPDPTSKCSCARCLGTDMCDQRCGIHEDCNPMMGAICPCQTGPNANRVFPTCQDCLATCPSGLGCFGVGFCTPIDLSCNTTPHCP